jgi:hypothetical protein
MGILDGHTYTSRGLSGMYLADGALSLLACILMAVAMRRFALHPAAQINAS